MSILCTLVLKSTTMRVILILATLSFLACKKKTVTPAPDITPVTPTCQTGAVKFAGFYIYQQGNKDTIQIVFLSNNCPKANSNTYVVKGLGKALQPMLLTGQTFAIKDYTITSDEVNGNAVNSDFTFNAHPDPFSGLSILVISCIKIQNTSNLFYPLVK